MRKLLLFLTPFLLAVVVFFATVFFLDQGNKKGALQVTSTPKSKIYINDKLVGETPLCKCEDENMLNPGQYTLRLVPGDDLPPYEEKITIAPFVLAVIDRTFGKTGEGSGKTITLTKLSDSKAIELLVLSFPQDVEVFLDSNSLGKTPLSNKTITASDHELRLVKDGYREKTIRIRAVTGYKLTVIASLGILPNIVQEASSSAPPNLVNTFSSVTPTAVKVIILNTPTGFLRVRQESSLASTEIGRVAPGESFVLLEEKTGWFKIQLQDEKAGWISSQYASKQ